MFFAFFVFSSCPLESKYIIPPNITAKTAITATYCIPVEIVVQITQKVSVSEKPQSEQPGRLPQFTGGTAENTTTFAVKNKIKLYIKDFNIELSKEYK